MPCESKTSSRRSMARERETQAFELRKAGYSYSKIAECLPPHPNGKSVTSQAVAKMITRVLARLAKLTEQNVDDVRRIELERLDVMLKGLWSKAEGGDESAVDRILKIMQRRAEMLGIDAPERKQIEAELGIHRRAADLTDDELAAIATGETEK